MHKNDKKPICSEGLKVKSLTNSNGNKVANQFVITTAEGTFSELWDNSSELHKLAWCLMLITGTTPGQPAGTEIFTGLDTPETKKRIKEGQIKFQQLNPDNHYAGYGY